MDTGTLPPVLSILVAMVAALYASVGFGGASGYLLVMSQFDIEPRVMASTALTLNVAVAGIAFISYARAGHVRWNLLAPFLLGSIPAAFIGGYFKVSNSIYFVLLYSVLTYAMLRMFFFSGPGSETAGLRACPSGIALASGALIGLLSGMVGIGGGIFLSPLIVLARWGAAKQAAGISAAFIVLNSISGLLGRLLGGNFTFGSFGLALLPFGILGALLGSRLGAGYFQANTVRRLLGGVLLIVVGRYWLTWL